jgi:YVTN family beta-propeller protein
MAVLLLDHCGSLRSSLYRDWSLVYSTRLTIFIALLGAAAVAEATDGGVYLYLQPLPPEAARLSFTVASVSAVTASGSEFPLASGLKLVGSAEAGRQRLLASGRLPAGRYAGFLFKVTRAALKSERGDVALVVPDVKVRLDVVFSVAERETPLFWLALKYQDSLTAGFDFSPVFSAMTPPRPIADHEGFVTNSGSNTITVFDKSLAQAAAVIDTCAGPFGMAVDQRRRRAYVACSKGDEIQSIDVAAGEIVERTRVSPGDQPHEIALTPDGATLVAVNTGSNSLSFFDAVSLTFQERINVGSGPRSILIDPGGRRAFVFNTLSSSVSVIDIASRSLAATLSMDTAPLRGQFSRSGDRLYVIHERSPYLTVLDPRQLTVVTRARLSSAVDAIAVDSVRGLVCLAGSHETAVLFYDPHALLPLYFMKTTEGVSHLMIDAADNRLYMVNPDTRTLIVGGLAGRKVVAEIDVGEGATWVAVMGER